ncbi:MAG: hypothetical protein ACUVT7_05200 [Thermoplasmata archaeon]
MKRNTVLSQRTGSIETHTLAGLFKYELYVAIYESLGEGVVLERDPHDGYLYRGRLSGRVILEYDRPEDHFCIELNRPIKIVKNGKRRIDVTCILGTPRFEERIEELPEKRRLFASFSYLPGISFTRRDPGNVTNIVMKRAEKKLTWIGIGELSLDPPDHDYFEPPWGMTE